MRQFFLSAALWGAAAAALLVPGIATGQSSAPPHDTGILAREYHLTLEEAATILEQNNNAMKISRSAVEAAKAQKQQLQAAWYPAISATGGYIHFSNEITADANMGELAQGLLQDLTGNAAGLEQLLRQLLPQLQQIIAGLSSTTLSVPLVGKNATSVDAVALWPLVTGGKRIYAGRIGSSLVESAGHLNTLTENGQRALMLNAYYTLKLARQVEQMQQENLQYIRKLQQNALRLKEEGFINKAEYLVVQVAADEASREYESARQSTGVAAQALNAILGKEISGIIPQGNFFTLDSIPPISHINSRILQHNPQLKILHAQGKILENKRKIAQSGYIPNFALFARQNLHSDNIPRNLLPRTIVGVAMQWDLFDGLAREKEIQKNRIEERQMEYTTDQAEDDLLTAALALRGSMEDASYNIETLRKSITLAEELLREREKSFAEGMCTSTDVVAARTTLTRARTTLDLAGWQYCTSLANLLALSADTGEFIRLHNAGNPITGNKMAGTTENKNTSQ